MTERRPQDAALQQQFIERRDLMLARAGARPILLIAGGILGFGLWDAWIEHSALARTLPMRALAAALLMIPFMLVRRRSIKGSGLRWVHGSVFLLGILGTTAATLQLPDGFLWGAAGISVFPVVLAVYPLPPRWYLGFNALAALGIMALVALTDAPARQLSNFIVMFALSVWVGWNVVHILRKQQWRLFLLEQQHAADARTDALTRLYNRRHIEQLGRRAVDAARALQRPLSVLMIDLDHFKAINDQRGHDIGDEALRLAAESLAATLRSVDHLGRWGGEEFLAVLPDTPAAQAEQVAARCLDRLRGADTSRLGEPRLRITASIGLASCEDDAAFDALIQRADRALYRAKRDGRNRVAIDQDDPAAVADRAPAPI